MNTRNCFIKMFVVLLGICIINTSCRKYIYQAPITSTYDAAFWTSQTSVEQATSAMYGQLRAALRVDYSYFVHGDLCSGNFLRASSQWNYGSFQASSNPPFNFAYAPYLEGSLQNWSRFYKLIALSNLILQNVPEMEDGLFVSQDVKNAYLGEALFIRAYTYFYMIRIWGDPVFVTRTYDDVDYGNIPPLPRTPESQVLDTCISDLKMAAGYLTYTGGDPAKSVRANKGTVNALLAHIYAWKHDYVNAHLACQEVITAGGYVLEPAATYGNIWKGRSSSESIFELSMNYNANDPNFTNQNEWAEAKFDFFNLFLKGPIVDDRKNNCWVSPQNGFVDEYMDTAADNRYKAVLSRIPASGSDGAGYMLMKYTRFNYHNADKKTGPYLDNNLVLMRLSDILLLDAEALAYEDDLEGARAALEKTQIRAGITDYQEPSNQQDMLDEIIAERGRELIGEGQWYYDLIRTNGTQHWLERIGYPADRVNATNKGYYWPLDMSALFPQNNLLTQNPWWSAHN